MDERDPGHPSRTVIKALAASFAREQARILAPMTLAIAACSLVGQERRCGRWRARGSRRSAAISRSPASTTAATGSRRGWPSGSVLTVGAHADDAGVEAFELPVTRSTWRRCSSPRSALPNAGCSTHLSVRCSPLPPVRLLCFRGDASCPTRGRDARGPRGRDARARRQAPGPARLARRRRRRPGDGGRVRAAGRRVGPARGQRCRIGADRVPLARHAAQEARGARPHDHRHAGARRRQARPPRRARGAGDARLGGPLQEQARRLAAAQEHVLHLVPAATPPAVRVERDGLGGASRGRQAADPRLADLERAELPRVLGPAAVRQDVRAADARVVQDRPPHRQARQGGPRGHGERVLDGPQAHLPVRRARHVRRDRTAPVHGQARERDQAGQAGAAT